LLALGLLVAEFIISYRKEPKADIADKDAAEALLEKEEY
jgi:hypothetical protein